MQFRIDSARLKDMAATLTGYVAETPKQRFRRTQALDALARCLGFASWNEAKPKLDTPEPPEATHQATRELVSGLRAMLDDFRLRPDDLPDDFVWLNRRLRDSERELGLRDDPAKQPRAGAALAAALRDEAWTEDDLRAALARLRSDAANAAIAQADRLIDPEVLAPVEAALGRRTLREGLIEHARAEWDETAARSLQDSLDANDALQSYLVAAEGVGDDALGDVLSAASGLMETSGYGELAEKLQYAAEVAQAIDPELALPTLSNGPHDAYDTAMICAAIRQAASKTGAVHPIPAHPDEAATTIAMATADFLTDAFLDAFREACRAHRLSGPLVGSEAMRTDRTQAFAHFAQHHGVDLLCDVVTAAVDRIEGDHLSGGGRPDVTSPLARPLAACLEDRGIEPEHLDQTIHAAFEKLGARAANQTDHPDAQDAAVSAAANAAAEINNQGLESQIACLLGQFGTREGFALIQRELGIEIRRSEATPPVA